MECKSCGAQIADESTQCPYCQAAVTRTTVPPTGASVPSGLTANKPPPSKIAAGLCGVLLGWLGIHKFILGYQKAGIIMLCISVLTCGYGGIIVGLIGLIEGIIYLTKSDEEFIQTYVNNKKEWF
jgi:TM2 domain-containing membrane protein YozV